MWFVSLKAPNQTDVSICEKKKANDSVLIPKTQLQKQMTIRDVISVVSSFITFEGQNFKKHYQSQFGLEFYVGFNDKKSLNLNQLQIFQWK